RDGGARLMRARLRSAAALARSRESGQILILFAVFLVVLMVLAGSAFDYASIVIDDARLQNAVDAAALAGSDSLSRNATLPNQIQKAIASQTAVAYLQLNGVDPNAANTNVQITFPTSTPISGVPTPATPVPENIKLQVSRSHATSFWPLVGIPQVSMA